MCLARCSMSSHFSGGTQSFKLVSAWLGDGVVLPRTRRLVFIDGLPAKQHYRKYKIQSSSVRAGHSDDFMSMAEVIRRRFRRWAQAKAEGADLRELRRAAGSALRAGLAGRPRVVDADGSTAASSVTVKVNVVGPESPSFKVTSLMLKLAASSFSIVPTP